VRRPEKSGALISTLYTNTSAATIETEGLLLDFSLSLSNLVEICPSD